MPIAEVHTARTQYILRAPIFPAAAHDGRDGGFLVSIEAVLPAKTWPSAELLRDRLALSRRETEVALLVAQGLSNVDIAERLFVSRHTVRQHIESVMAKLEVTGRGREAVAARILEIA